MAMMRTRPRPPLWCSPGPTRTPSVLGQAGRGRPAHVLGGGATWRLCHRHHLFRRTRLPRPSERARWCRLLRSTRRPPPCRSTSIRRSTCRSCRRSQLGRNKCGHLRR
jgi:hypothetical protein